MIRYLSAFALALLTTAATPARAEWVKIYEGNLGSSHIDLATVRQNGDLAQVRQLQDLDAAAVTGEMSRQLLVEYDCKESRSRVLSYSSHSGVMATGTSLVPGNVSGSSLGPWSASSPNSPAESIRRNVSGAQT
jgi:hypothetical protein